MLVLDNLNFHFRNFHFCLIFGLKIYRVPKARQQRKVKKASQVNDIAVKVIKENKETVAFFAYHNFNNPLLWISTFLTALKYADVKPVFKQDDKTDKENYRPISILATWSKRKNLKDLYITICIRTLTNVF